MKRLGRTKLILLSSSVVIALAGCSVAPGPHTDAATALVPSMSSQSSVGVAEGDTRLVSFVDNNQLFEIEQQLVCSVDGAARQSSACPCTWVALSRAPVAQTAAQAYDGQPCVQLEAQSTQGLRNLAQPGTAGIVAGAGLLLLLGLAGGGGSSDGT
jgi:hypothetical protein